MNYRIRRFQPGEIWRAAGRRWSPLDHLLYAPVCLLLYPLAWLTVLAVVILKPMMARYDRGKGRT